MRLPLGSVLFIVLSLLAMGTQCHKDYPPVAPAYEFSEKLTLSPYQKVYALNDTVWVQFRTYDHTLFDRLSNSRTPIDTTFLRVGLQYRKLYNTGAAKEFFGDIVVDNTLNATFKPLYTLYNQLDFQTACNNDPYYFKAGFVPKKTGIYSIRAGATVAPCPDKLSYKYSTFQFTFDLADCNKDVYLSIPSEYRKGDNTEAAIDKKEAFVFRVE